MRIVLENINRMTKTLHELLPMKPEDQARLDKKFRLEFNFNSNHIEGNTLTYGETELLLIFGDTKGSHAKREYDEMEAHDVAFKMIREWAADKEFRLTEAHIKNLNQIILVKPFWKEAITSDGQQTRKLIKIGDYKETPNSVRLPNGEIFPYASPTDTPILMGELMQWYNQQVEENRIHPVELASKFHYKFVCIHPFDDGNGRLSRLLMNYVLLHNNLPPVIIRSAEKAGYLRALHLADTGDVDAFIDYVGEQLLWSLDISIRAARGESIDEPQDLDKKLSLLKKRLGEEPDVKVQLSYSTEAFKEVVHHSVLPLTRAWEERLQQFSPFFLDRSVALQLAKRSSNYKGFGSDFEKELISLAESTFFKDNNVRGLTLQSHFRGVRKIGNSISVNGGEIRFIFYEHAYEVDYTGCTKPFNKLYHQALTEDETQIIVLGLGNWLHTNLEQILEKNL